MMSEFDFDLDHLDFDTAEQKTNAEQSRQQQVQLEQLAELQDDGDDCAGGACKI